MRGIWIHSWWLLAAIGVAVFAIIFAVAGREIRDAFTDLLRRD
jgi:divalent metal cation (Fe/Co/Zn/Cd) transporter